MVFCLEVKAIVHLKKVGTMPFPRRLNNSEIDRFWLKFREDIIECGEIVPNISWFYKHFSDLTYDSFEEAVEYSRYLTESICRGEEPTIPDKFFKPND